MTMEIFPNLSFIFQHCKGFNSILGSSHQQSVILFKTIADQQKAFLQRYEGGIVGIHLVAIHHQNVPTKLQTNDNQLDKSLIM
jgi:hypothetical protein